MLYRFNAVSNIHKCELAIQRVAHADASIRIIIFYALILLLFVEAHLRPCQQ